MGIKIRKVGFFGEEIVVIESWYRNVYNVIYKIELGDMFFMKFNLKVFFFLNELMYLQKRVFVWLFGKFLYIELLLVVIKYYSFLWFVYMLFLVLLFIKFVINYIRLFFFLVDLGLNLFFKQRLLVFRMFLGWSNFLCSSFIFRGF